MTNVYSPMSSENAYTTIKEHALDQQNFEDNVWGATLLVIVKDVPDIVAGEAKCGSGTGMETWLRTSFIFVCYILNAGMQICLIMWIITKITLPSMKDSQDLYAKFHQVAFVPNGDGSFKFDQHKFDNEMGPDANVLCEFGLSKRAFLYGILFLWLSQCMQEFKSIERTNRFLRMLPDLPKGLHSHEMVWEIKKDGENQDHFQEEKDLLVCVNTLTRILVYILIIIPKMLILVVLAFAGSTWLIASESSSDLVLNSLALGFIVQVDEMIHMVYLPARMSKNLEKTKFALPTDKTISPEIREAQSIQSAYQRSFVYLIGVICCVYLVVRFQVIFPGYAWDVRAACIEHVKQTAKPRCLAFPWEDKQCFPYSGQEAKEL